MVRSVVHGLALVLLILVEVVLGGLRNLNVVNSLALTLMLDNCNDGKQE